MFCLKIIQINVAGLRIMRIFAVRFERNEVLTREHSSVGLEHLPYKQRVGGSTPSAPTTKPWIRPRLFSLFCDERSFRVVLRLCFMAEISLVRFFVFSAENS